jgi:hypothetical protein
MTTQLAPRLEGRAEPAIEFSSASGESTTVSLSAPAEPAANSSSASESTALPTDGDGGVINPKSLGSDQGIDKNNEPPCDPEDRVLPLYGDSEYDTEDQREIDALPEKKTPDPPPVPINLTKFNDILDQLILNKREEWVGGFTNDPFRSSPMWIERDDAAVRDRAQKNIVHLRIRLSKLRDAMYANRYTSEALVFKACECLDETLKDLFFCEWQSAMLDSMKRSREQNQQVESTPHGVNTPATSGSPYSSFNENDGNGRNSNASDEEGDTCDSTGDEQHESATKKPRLETHGPDNTVPQATQDVIDLTGDSPEPTQAFNPDTPLPSLANRAMWMQNQRTHKPGPSRKAYYAAQKRRQKARAECIKAEEDDKDAQRRFRIAGSSAFASLPLQEASMSSNHRSESPCHSVTDPSLPPRAVPSEKVQISAVKGHSSSITSKEEEAMYQ